MDDPQKPVETQPALAAVAFRGLCPRCGAPTLFDGWIKFAGKCRACELDFSRFNVGDGPAAFLTLIIGALVTVLGIVVDQVFHPPLLLLLIALVPVTAGAVIYGLRITKAALLALEYWRGAGEGQIKK